MRHVGRFDPETKLPITEVTQAEFDALPSSRDVQDCAVGSMWTFTHSYGCSVLAHLYANGANERRVAHRRIMIVDQSEPAVRREDFDRRGGASSATAGADAG